MDAIAILKANCDNSFFPKRSSDLTLFDNLDKQFVSFIKETNGGYFFSRSIHIYGSSPEAHFHDLHYINNLLKGAYLQIAKDCLFFGCDLFGNQFAFHEDKIVFFNIESGDKEVIGENFLNFLDSLLNDLDYFSGRTLLFEWQKSFGSIAFNERLTPKLPFIIGGEYSIGNLIKADFEKVLSFNGNLALQIHDLPEGTEIKIEFTP